MGARFATPLLLTTQKLIPDSGMWFDGVDVLSPPLVFLCLSTRDMQHLDNETLLSLS